MKLVTSATMKSLDRFTIETVGIPGIVLMESAGRGVSDLTETILRESGRKIVLILCGPGNNGGDGFVVARHLSDKGFQVLVALLAEPANLSGDAFVNYRVLQHFPVEILQIGDEIPAHILRSVTEKGVVVDAIFGTGLARNVEGRFAKIIETINSLSCPKIAVDIPSGVCSDTGRILGIAFKADLTVTFGCAKIGHYVYPGRSCCGKIVVVPIGIPSSKIAISPGATLIEKSNINQVFARRDKSSFKNRFGHLAFIGGFLGKAGAGLLSAMSAVRVGAGLVTIMTDRLAQAHCEGRFPELMIEGPFERIEEGVTPDQLFEALEPREKEKKQARKSLANVIINFSPEELGNLLKEKTAIAIGPGLSTLPGCDAILDFVLSLQKPCVLDADALNILATKGSMILGQNRVITPHPGEASRLLGRSTADIQSNRIQTALDLVAKYQTIVVLKGAGTIIASPDGRLAINETGGPGLATAGTGDVLTGIIGGLLARGVSAWESACAGVYLHGLAGDIAEERLTDHSVGASDVVDAIPLAIKEVLS